MQDTRNMISLFSCSKQWQCKFHELRGSLDPLPNLTLELDWFWQLHSRFGKKNLVDVMLWHLTVRTPSCRGTPVQQLLSTMGEGGTHDDPCDDLQCSTGHVELLASSGWRNTIAQYVPWLSLTWDILGQTPKVIVRLWSFQIPFCWNTTLNRRTRHRQGSAGWSASTKLVESIKMVRQGMEKWRLYNEEKIMQNRTFQTPENLTAGLGLEIRIRAKICSPVQNRSPVEIEHFFTGQFSWCRSEGCTNVFRYIQVQMLVLLNHSRLVRERSLQRLAMYWTKKTPHKSPSHNRMTQRIKGFSELPQSPQWLIDVFFILTVQKSGRSSALLGNQATLSNTTHTRTESQEKY